MKKNSLSCSKNTETNAQQKIMALALATGLATGCGALDQKNDQAENLLDMTRQCHLNALSLIDDCIEGVQPKDSCVFKEFSDSLTAGVKEEGDSKKNSGSIYLKHDEENHDLKGVVCNSTLFDGKNKQSIETVFNNSNTGSILNLTDTYIKGSIQNDNQYPQTTVCHITNGKIECIDNVDQTSRKSYIIPSDPYGQGYENMSEIDKTLAHSAREVQAQIKKWQTRNNTRK